MNILFVGLFVAWERDGTIPDTSGPPLRKNTKVTAAHARSAKIVSKWILKHHIAQHCKDGDDSDWETDPKATPVNCNYRQHYENILQFSVGTRILATRSISSASIKCGIGAFSRAFQSWARMHTHMKPYLHLILHLDPALHRDTSMYNIWVWMQERANGFLGRKKTNGCPGGELEGTLMRAWWKVQLLETLVNSSPA